VGSSIAQAWPQGSGMGASAATGFGAEATAGTLTATALSLPSVPRNVDFSTWLAERERR